MGVLGVLAGLVAVGFAIEGISDFGNPAVPVRFTILGEVLLCSMAFFGLSLGISSLRMAWNGRDERKNNWIWPIILGIGSFFPGFLFSLPLTLFWANRTWPGDGQSSLAAIEVSVYIGIAAAIICGLVLFIRRNPPKTKGPI
jgi:cytochrome bd-type quinol oxidase subunit 2